ncbi:MAG: branched-chain amino acid--2-keto-4-methylthiobutyrate aminotransferase, partial [Candidatus Thioglobus sp.]|nr:branched-chain amino acid--2-keto-4-methylthiobutyrate aminotransferase [Candidatus Thioglobus sp.]
MVFLNGQFIEKQQAFVPVMDRGFLFGDGVYEVIPVYQGKIFHLAEHL